MTNDTILRDREPVRVLLIDDDPRYADYVRLLLGDPRRGIQVEAVTSIDAGLRTLASRVPDVCLLDYRLGSDNGLDLLRSAKAIGVRTPIVLLTAEGDPTLELTALEEGAADYLDKSEVNTARLLSAIRRAAARHRADVNLRRRETALAQSERRYRSMVRNAPYGIFEAAPDGRFLGVNPALAAMLGHDAPQDVLQLAPDALYESADERARVMAAVVGSGRYNRVETRWRRRDGSIILVSICAHLVLGSDGHHVVDAVVEDVTEQRRLEDQLRQAQKMEAVGRLAGGVAHDFNNLLTAILGYTALLRDRDLEGDVQEDLDQIQQAASSAAALTEQLLAFSRKQVLNPQVVSVNGVIAETQGLLSRLLGEDIRIFTDLRADVPRVQADPVQLKQVLLNLGVNARDAMPMGGRLRIETSEVLVERGDGHVAGVALAPGRYVAVTVQDEGCGMDDRTRARIFEPFFTTKEQGRGTGLGLATVYGIVKQTGGEIACESAPGAGTTFHIFLPASASEAEAEPPAVRCAAPQGAGTVLLVEDHEPLRRLACRILEAHGFTVLQAADAAEALKMAEGAQFDLLLTDVVMPGMTGPELAGSIAALAPDCAILFMSGFTGHSAVRQAPEVLDAPLLSKPFTPGGLIAGVIDTLRQRRCGAPLRSADRDARGLAMAV